MLYRNTYDFSYKVEHWLEKGRAIRALIRHKLGREYNIANVKRTAEKCGITDPLSFTRQELWTRYWNCKKKCAELPADLPWLRKTFLLARLHDDLENGREEEANNIQTIIRGKK